MAKHPKCKCPWCGKEFYRRNSRQQYCCQKCGIIANRREKHEPRKVRSEKTCKICGKKYKSSHKNSVTCSKQCANEWQTRTYKGSAIKKFNDRNKGCYFYLNGYEKYESDIYARCVQCNSVIHLGKGVMRKVARDCPECARQARRKTEWDAMVFKEENTRKRKIEKEKKRLSKIKNREVNKKCLHCGETFITTNGKKKYCSKRCCNRAGEKKKEIVKRMREKRNGNIDWNISLELLAKRDKGICHICKRKIDWTDFKTTKEGAFIALKNYPSIDHVYPISMGGTHTWENVRLSHKRCNEVKSNKMVYEGAGGQMMLSL